MRLNSVVKEVTAKGTPPGPTQIPHRARDKVTLFRVINLYIVVLAHMHGCTYYPANGEGRLLAIKRNVD